MNMFNPKQLPVAVECQQDCGFGLNMFNPKQLPVTVECQQDCGFTCELDESTKNFIKDSIKEAIRGKPDYN